MVDSYLKVKQIVLKIKKATQNSNTINDIRTCQLSYYFRDYEITIVLLESLVHYGPNFTPTQFPIPFNILSMVIHNYITPIYTHIIIPIYTQLPDWSIFVFLNGMKTLSNFIRLVCGWRLVGVA